MATRQSITALDPAGSPLAQIRDAWAAMKAVLDDRGFDWFASIHGLPLPIWCEHHTTLFLPWHRAYLYFFELALQTRLGARFTIQTPANPAFADVGIPWWDWTSPESHASGVPQAFAPAAGNPLADSVAGACGGAGIATGVWSQGLLQLVRQQLRGTITAQNPPTTLRDPDVPDELPQAATITDLVMPQRTFLDFSTALEQVHDQVHVWVGGAMGQVPTAAYDPIFYAHHAMIDRLWYLWQLSPNGAPPPDQMLDVILMPFPMTVRQTLDISMLGYDYAVGVIV